jgi:hypothetical protein
MVVHNFHVVRVVLSPDEADPPLIVEANAVLARSISRKRFQPIPRQVSEVAQAQSIVEEPEFAPRDFLDVPETPASLPVA